MERTWGRVINKTQGDRWFICQYHSFTCRCTWRFQVNIYVYLLYAKMDPYTITFLGLNAHNINSVFTVAGHSPVALGAFTCGRLSPPSLSRDMHPFKMELHTHWDREPAALMPPATGGRWCLQ